MLRCFVPRSRSAPFLSAALALGLLAAACGGAGNGGGEGCNPPFREQLDPNWELHPTSSDGITYLSNPPTSGPHQVWFSPPGGVIDIQLDPLRQIGVLEAGLVLVHVNGLSADVLRELAPMATLDVMVMPNSTIDAPLVATASQWKMVCEDVSLDTAADVVAAIADFAAEHVDRATASTSDASSDASGTSG